MESTFFAAVLKYGLEGLLFAASLYAVLTLWKRNEAVGEQRVKDLQSQNAKLEALTREVVAALTEGRVALEATAALLNQPESAPEPPQGPDNTQGRKAKKPQ